MAAKDNIYGSIVKNIIRFLINYFVRFGYTFVIVYVCRIAIVNYNYWFSWHVILCTLAYLPLMAESIILFAGDEIWSKQMSRKHKNIIHGVLISVGTGFAIAGNSICFYYLEPGYHLYTEHGITGFVSMILLILSIFLGLIANFTQEIKKILPIPVVYYKIVHNLIGLLGYGVGIISLCYAFYTNWFVFYTSEDSRTVALVVTIICSLWSVNSAFASGYNQIKTIFKLN